MSDKILQALPNFLIAYKGLIYLLSVAVSLLCALVIFWLLRHFRVLRQDKWVRPFAWAFIALAALYLVRFLFWLFDDYSQITSPDNLLVLATAIGSSFSNYFFFGV